MVNPATTLSKKLNRWIQNKMALTGKNRNRYASGFPLLYKTAHFMNKPILGPLGRKLAWLENFETRFTQGHVVPINVDLNFRQQYKDMVLPVDYVRKAINVYRSDGIAQGETAVQVRAAGNRRQLDIRFDGIVRKRESFVGCFLFQNIGGNQRRYR